MQRRWFALQIFAIVLACIYVALTYDREKHWYNESIVVALWIAVAPLFLRSSFLASRSHSMKEELGAKARVLIIGMVLIQIANVGMGFLHVVEWSFALAFVLGAAVVQVGACVMLLSGR